MEHATWIEPRFELPLLGSEDPTYSETYQVYVWSPSTSTGVWMHLTYATIGRPGWWEQQVLAVLPDDRFLMAKVFAPGTLVQDGLSVGGLDLTVSEPLDTWEIRYTGCGRVVSGAEMRGGGIADGPHEPVSLALTCAAFTPAYDLGTSALDSVWAHGHYEQHHVSAGSLHVGSECIPLQGRGIRNRSWGPRDYRPIGTTTWLHAQFPDSERAIMAIHVGNTPPHAAFEHAVLATNRHTEPVDVTGIPLARDVAETEHDYEMVVGGKPLRATILGALRMTFVGRAETCLGTLRSAAVNHDYVQAFTRYDWAGETGYGVTERTVDHAGE